MVKSKLTFIDLGEKPYRSVWSFQKYLFDKLIVLKKQDIVIDNEYIIFVEHQPVFTIGKHGKQNNMLFNKKQLEEKGAEFIHIERGGDVTFHGPGQLVVYPIIDLSKHKLGVKNYVELLEECVIQLLQKYNIKGERVNGATGVWIDKGMPNERKICAIGVKCSYFVSMHGFALNVNTDLNWFSAINPCGFIDKGVTSLEKELGHKVDIIELKEKTAEIISSLLNK